jgi:hypothetical protein
VRTRLIVLGAVLFAAGCGGSSSKSSKPQPRPTTTTPAPPATATTRFVKATLVTPTHTPKVNVKWRYTVSVTDRAGRALSGKLTIQIVDPLGAPHAVQYDDTKKDITRRPFKGRFRDYLEFPGSSRGYKLTFRVIATTSKGKVDLTYPVTPR